MHREVGRIPLLALRAWMEGLGWGGRRRLTAQFARLYTIGLAAYSFSVIFSPRYFAAHTRQVENSPPLANGWVELD